MKQITYRLDSREDFLKFTAEVLASDDYKNAKEVIFKVITAQLKNVDIKDLQRRMKAHFPNAKVVGASMTNFVAKRTDDINTPNWTIRMKKFLKDYVLISCCYFYSSHVTVIEVDSTEVDDFTATTLELNQKLKKIPDLQGVEILCAGGKERVAPFLEILTVGLEKVPFFGAEAGAVEREKVTCQFKLAVKSLTNKGVNQFVMGNNIHHEGVVMVAYSGKDLHVTAEYNFGWKPIGKEMTITETLGVNGVSKIDDVPAVDIYKKYLNVDPAV